MKKVKSSFFELNLGGAALALAIASSLTANLAQANAGFGGNTDITGHAMDVPTFFATSPQGIRAAYDPATHALSTTGLTVDTGAPIRKFIDPLGGVYNGLENLPGLTDLKAGIPVAITEKWLNPLTGVQTKDDYYELATVEYTEQLHSDLAKPTHLRGYVQIETPAIAAGLKDITGIIGSEHITATYPDGTLIKDIHGAQVYFVHKPHYLGPVVLASHGTPIRVKFTNYLPYTDSTGKSVGSAKGTGGESQIPVDETLAGGGPILDGNGNPVLDTNPLSPNFNKPIKFPSNRTAIHWHGGDTPWISDGTPHEWFTPAGDISRSIPADAAHPKGFGVGASYENVPDMPDPGAGSQTIYWPVQELSGRLMMYHDHVSGTTRTNVYEGEAAGLVVLDPTEMTLAANALGTTLATKNAGGLPTGLLDAVGIPLVIQDKTFLPKNVGPNAVASDGVTPASQDAKWDLNHWGQPGDFFFPHVYETNQDPNSIDGTNPVGRWDWGPWFWPVFPATFSLPTGAYGDVTTTPEAFMDTPITNGQAYPTMTVDPKTYRFRILSVANDRSFNFGLYQAVDGAGKVCDASNTAPTPNPTQAYTINGVAQGAPALCTEVKMVPAQPTAGFPATWPTDGRVGGVPDPATAGPDFVQIGNEGGLLPAVDVIKSQPITYDQNVRSITVFNVLEHGLTLMPAERADVFVDFSNYAGQTLILYNDAPAPFPGYDPRIDYFTGVGDQTAAGGAYDTLPGYGPNTRTVMQIKVNTAAASSTGKVGPSLNVAALTAALPVAYAATQPKPLMPEKVYNAAFGTADVDSYAKIGTGANTIPYFVPAGVTFALTGFKVIAGGSGYLPTATATFSAPSCTPLGTATCAVATAAPIVDPLSGAITGFTGFTAGAGYTNTAPITVTFSATAGSTASASVTTTGYAVINKAIQELFDPMYGRMNATLAVELPFSTATVATTIPLAYIDTPVDYLDGIKDGETQIWKITHNGVDSHPVHFHLVNVQLINRVGWDGVIKAPAANEVGWRETLRMNPLEDVYVMAKASHPVVPFGLPESHRVLDPSQSVGSQLSFTQIDPITGAAPTTQTYMVNGVSTVVPLVAPGATGYSNQMTNFDNEYVWHCHILGHEEFDFMRPFVFHPTVIVPDAPAAVTVSGSNVSWTDPTPYGGQDAQGIPTAGTNAAHPDPISSTKNEIGFNVLLNGVKVGSVPANVTTWTDTSVPALNLAGGTVTVVAYNAAGPSLPGTSATRTTASSTVTAATPPAATPGTIAVTGTLDATGTVVTVTTPATTVGFVLGASVTGGGFPQGTTITAITSATFTTSYVSTAAANSSVTLTVSQLAANVTPTPAASAAPIGLTQTLQANGDVLLAWTAVPGATSYTVTVNGTISTVLAPATSFTAPAATILAGGNTFTVTATTLSGTTVAATTALSNNALLAPVAFAGAADAVGSGSITLQWANNALNVGNVANLLLTWNGSPAAGVKFLPTTKGVTVIGLTKGTAYTFNLSAVSNVTTVNPAAATAITVTAP